MSLVLVDCTLLTHRKLSADETDDLQSGEESFLQAMKIASAAKVLGSRAPDHYLEHWNGSLHAGTSSPTRMSS
jgi:hypothetical protein